VAIAPGTPISRRSLLVGAGALALLTGCSYFGTDEPPAPTVVSTPAALDPINGLIATTRLHLLRLDAAIAADQADAARLTPLRDDRQAHLTALEAEFARVNPAAVSGSATAAASGTVTARDGVPSPAGAWLAQPASADDASSTARSVVNALRDRPSGDWVARPIGSPSTTMVGASDFIGSGPSRSTVTR